MTARITPGELTDRPAVFQPLLEANLPLTPSIHSTSRHPFESIVPSQNGLCCIATFQQYDVMGRIANQWQYLPTGCACDFAMPYTYDLMGNMIISSDPYENSFTYGYNSAGRLASVTGSYSDSDDPANLLSAMKYNAAGQLASDALGDGEGETYTYDSRLRLQSMSSVLGSTPIYNYSLTLAPNGNVLTANDSVNGNWNYSYDQFNRLVCASVSSNTACAFPPAGTPTYNYVYDRFGNRWQQNSPAGNIYTSSFSFTGNGGTNNNRLDPSGYIGGVGNVTFQYDAAGNLQFDGVHHYFYDAENRLIQVDGSLPYCTSNGASGSAATACYYYDADGKRVWRTGYTNDNCDNTGKRGYVFDLAGHVIVETNGTGTDCDIQVYAGDRHFGRQGGGSYFYHSDWLGTVRLVNSDQYPYVNQYNGDTCTSLPFGDGLTCTSNTANVWHFTGKERDYESNLDFFGARFNASQFGRFLSADPENAGSDVSDPQSWNAYSYVEGSPINMIDPDGLAPQQQCTIDGGSVACSMALDLIPQGAGSLCPGDCSHWKFVPGNGFDTLLNTAPLGSPDNPRIDPDCSTTNCVLVSPYYPLWSRRVDSQGLCSGALCLSALRTVSDFSAGAGDCLTGRCIPFVHSSLTQWGRGSADAVVNKNSWSYAGGEVTGGAIASAIGGLAIRAGVAPGGWLNSNRYLRIGFGRFGGNRVFRVAGKALDWLKRTPGAKWDIWRGGPL